jgi:uncharacterized Rmd1/YagE family protein
MDGRPGKESAAMSGNRAHVFRAVAFVENFNLKALAPAFPGCRLTPRELSVSVGNGELFLYPFGAAVFRDLPGEVEEAELARLRRADPGVAPEVLREEFSVLETGGPHSVSEGTLEIDRLTPERARIVALTVAQSAAMEYYEGIVERLSARTQGLVGRLETRGTVPMRMRSHHRFIGEAIATRAEVLGVLHLLDKPDETWEDPLMDRLYADLRSQFDLADRYEAMESKLRAVQEALELMLDVARDRRMFLLEAAIVFLILVEILAAVVR